MAICSFCRQDRKPTKEHIWSCAVLRVFDDVAPFTIDNQRGIVHGDDPLINDLCADCNNNKLTDCDSEMGRVAQVYLSGGAISLGTEINWNAELVKRWILKTASNQERGLKGPSNWWEALVDFMLGNALLGGRPVDFFFAPWRSPLDPAIDRLMDVTGQPLQAATTLVGKLAIGDDSIIRPHVEASWSLRVGYGVFCFIFWKEPNLGLRKQFSDALTRYGWLTVEPSLKVAKVPFDQYTCLYYWILVDPEFREEFHVTIHKHDIAEVREIVEEDNPS